MDPATIIAPLTADGAASTWMDSLDAARRELDAARRELRERLLAEQAERRAERKAALDAALGGAVAAAVSIATADKVVEAVRSRRE